MRARRVGPEEAHLAYALVAACGRVLSDKYALHQWLTPPPVAQMQEEAATRELYVVDDADGQAIATFLVGLTPIAAYTTAQFDLAEPALYLNRLAVLPSLWGHGVGSFCMQQVDARARALGVTWVRFDTVSAAGFLRRFYRRLGYAEHADFAIGDIPVTCFQKRVA